MKFRNLPGKFFVHQIGSDGERAAADKWIASSSLWLISWHGTILKANHNLFARTGKTIII